MAIAIATYRKLAKYCARGYVYIYIYSYTCIITKACMGTHTYTQYTHIIAIAIYGCTYSYTQYIRLCIATPHSYVAIHKYKLLLHLASYR